METSVSQGSNFESVFKAMKQPCGLIFPLNGFSRTGVYRGSDTGKTGTPNYKVRKLMKKDPSEWIVLEDAHEPLILHSDLPPSRACLRVNRRACGDPEKRGTVLRFSVLWRLRAVNGA
jgi:hypothetical protein